MSSWEIKTMHGFRVSHTYIVVDPACPPGRHPTRDCGCTVFRTLTEAAAYKGRMEALTHG